MKVSDQPQSPSTSMMRERLLDTGGRLQTTALAATTFAVWLSAVVLVAARHEFTRDEVRAWSLAQSARTLPELFQVVREDGHPLLWYLILRVGGALTESPLTLPVVSIAIAAGVVILVLTKSPYPLWVRLILPFTPFLLYVYSVSARNYGLTTLLLFVAAILYRRRSDHPYPFAITLGLLANSHVYGAVFAAAIALPSNLRRCPQNATGRFWRSAPLGAVLLVVVGLALCSWTVTPPSDTVVTHFREESLRDIGHSFLTSISQPARNFEAVVPDLWGPLEHVALYLAVAALLPQKRLLVSALAGLWMISVISDVVYPAVYRHQGLVLMFLLALHWMAAGDKTAHIRGASDRRVASRKRDWTMWALATWSIILTPAVLKFDYEHELSSSKAFGAALTASPDLHEAILVPEPGGVLESLPYYASNRIFLPREGRFSSTPSLTMSASGGYTLQELLSTAKALSKRSSKPVLLVLGHRISADHGTVQYPYRSSFTWSPEGIRDLSLAATLIYEFRHAVTQENYAVYRLTTGQ